MRITLDQFRRRLDRAGSGALRLLVVGALRRATLQAQKHATLMISIPAPEFQIGGASSVPSPVLHVRTGRLRSSIRSGVRRSSSGGIEGWLRAGGSSKLGQVNYAAVHELGLTVSHPTRGMIKMRKRPFLKPSIEEAAKNLPKALAPLLARALKADV